MRDKLTRKERKKKQKGFRKQTGKSKKSRNSSEVKYTLKQLEDLYWNNEKLSTKEKIIEIDDSNEPGYPQDAPFIVDDEKKYRIVLNIVKKATKGFGLSISGGCLEQLINDFKLELKQRHYNMTGEASALFEYEGETIRLERDWMGCYKVYHGDWQPDPHWTGD